MDRYLVRKPCRLPRDKENRCKKARGSGEGFELLDSARLLVYHHRADASSAGATGLASGKRKLATFDLDQTLITTRSGKKLASLSDPSDWQWLHPTKIASRLCSLHQDGFELAVFSNQAGIGADPTGLYLLAFQQKLSQIVDALEGVPISIYVALFKDVYRKPCPGMWDAWKKRAGVSNQQDEIDWARSFFVGDAAGRPEGWSAKVARKPADFADTDRKFALNVGLLFFTPDEFFMGHEKIELPALRFHPKDHGACVLQDDSLISFPSAQEVILLVGLPGSGKTTLFETLLAPKGYCAVSQDALKTRKACIAKSAFLIEAGHSIVIDCTNPSRASRSDYVQQARSHRVPIRCFLLDSSYELAYHLNMYRSLTEASHPPVPQVAYEKYKRDFERPQRAEGFSEVLEIGFRLRGDGLKNERLFYSLLY